MCPLQYNKLTVICYYSISSKSGFYLENGQGGGQNNTLRKFRGTKGLQATTCPLEGSVDMPPRKVLNFRPPEIASGTFSDHLWFSNNMMR